MSDVNININNNGNRTNSEDRKNPITELVFILDKSGSMAGYEADTVGGFNATLARQKAEAAADGGQVWVSTVLFDNGTRVLHDRLPIEAVKPLTEEDYTVGGCTALLDAIGGAIHHIGNIHKYARPEDVPAHTVFLITTDGMENASHRYDSDTVKAQIRRQTEKYGWEFLFLAANIDAVETAERIGIHRERAANYRQDSRGVRSTYAAMSTVISSVRAGRAVDNDDWRRELEED